MTERQICRERYFRMCSSGCWRSFLGIRAAVSTPPRSCEKSTPVPVRLNANCRACSRADLVSVEWIGNQKHYRANRNSPIFTELQSIILKTAGLAEPLRQSLVPYADRIKVAFVYGSVAKGSDTAQSDIDLMVVGDDLSYATCLQRCKRLKDFATERKSEFPFLMIGGARSVYRFRHCKNKYSA